MKTNLILCAAVCLFTLSCGGSQQKQSSGNYPIADYLNTLDETKADSNSSGWAYWFVPKGEADTLTIKMSSVWKVVGTHEPHAHNEDEAFFIAQGPVIVHLNGEERELQTGDFFYTPSNSSHNIRRAGEGPIKYLVMKRETTEKLDKPYTVAKADYTMDDCTFFPMNDANWASGAPGRVIAIDENFSDGLRVAMRRVTKDDAAFQNQEPHAHTQEVIYIVSGQAEVTLDNSEPTVIGPNTSFYCPAGVMHSIKQVGEEPMVFLAIITY